MAWSRREQACGRCRSCRDLWTDGPGTVVSTVTSRPQVAWKARAPRRAFHSSLENAENRGGRTQSRVRRFPQRHTGRGANNTSIDKSTALC